MNFNEIKKIDHRFDPIIVGLLAFLIRLIYISQLSATPFFESPIVDAEFHDVWARDIIDKGIGHEGAFFRAPLYPYFLSMIYYLSNGSYFAARLAQILLGTATSMLTVLLGYALTKKRSVGLISGIGTALYGMLVYFDGELLVETLFIPLLLATFLAYSKFRRQNKSPLMFIPGVLLGLAAITRPSALILVPIFILDTLHQRHTESNQLNRRRGVIHGIVILAGFCLPILPVTWHNAYQCDDFSLIATSGGLNYYIGNNVESDGLHSHLPGMGSNWDVRQASMAAYKAEGRTLKSSEISSYYYHLGRQYLLNHTWEATKLTVRKFFAFWNRHEISNNRDLYFFQNETLIMPYLRFLGFWLVAPFGLLGLWVGFKKRLLPAWFLWITPVYMAGVIVFFVTARFRVPIIPLLFIMGVTAVVSWLEERGNLFI